MAQSKLTTQEIRDLSMQDLKDRIEEETALYKKKQFSHAVSQMENPLELRGLRRDIARLKTELTQRVKAEENKA